MKERVLAARGLEKSYKGRRVVGGVDLEVRSGQVVGLLGPNGAGKTTTFHLVVGLITPDRGRILLDEHDLTGMPLSARARAGISYLPQELSVFRKLTVADNLLAVLETLDIDEAEQQARKERLLAEFRLAHLADNLGNTLSGGEQRRLEIARALVIEPAFMLMDEPFAGVDPIAVLNIQTIIRQLRAQGIGVLISAHTVRETLGVCDTAYILDQGAILEHGSPERIAASPKAREIYLGEQFTL